MIRVPVCLILFSFLMTPLAEARVFKFKDESIAAYFRGTYGLVDIADDAYKNSSGTGNSVEDEIGAAFTGELGTLIQFGTVMNLRLAVQLIQAKKSDMTVEDASSAKMAELTSQVFVFNPMAVVEVNAKHSDTWRIFMYGGAGLANWSMDNTYVTEPAAGISDYTEKSEATSVSGVGGIGFETLFSDNVTFSADIGYRYLRSGEMEYKGDATGFNGAITKGEKVVDNNGDARKLDLSGPFVGIGFRFFIDII